MTHIEVRTPTNASVNFVLNTLPDTCPICHKGIEPKILLGTPNNPSTIEPLQLVLQCPRSDCGNVFIGLYSYVAGDSRQLVLLMVSPIKPSIPSVRQTIARISPSFVDIFEQAHQAEELGLKELVGMGLRKSLEFLIKDFLMQEHPHKKEEIKKQFLEPCIKEFISDDHLKECARRAVWLGNDETHYTRRWVDKDIEDLKILIDLTMNWMESVLLTRKYLADMPDPSLSKS